MSIARIIYAEHYRKTALVKLITLNNRKIHSALKNRQIPRENDCWSNTRRRDDAKSNIFPQ